MNSFYGTKKGGGGWLNANISWYLSIKYTTEAYICVRIPYHFRNQFLELQYISEQVGFGILHNMNSTAVNGDIFITNRQGGTFAFEHLYLQIPDIHMPYDVFWG